MKQLLFTVTNDLTYDQRMIRICTSLSEAGYRVTLIGRKLPDSKPLENQRFQQKRLGCFFRKGKAFYAEYNTRLFFYLLFKRADLICAIDLDTILPVYFITRIKRSKRVYDAHELFCEMKEVVTRPNVYKLWKRIERFSLPQFKWGYTVSAPIAEEFRRMYGVQYAVIRNLPHSFPLTIPEKKEKFILYQGAVNEGRSFETLIPAMQDINARLIIAGDGNFMSQARELVQQYKLTEKVIFTGKLSPAALFQQTLGAWIGITLFENNGLSNYYSLANRFSDYINAGIPQLCVDYPVYRELNKNSPVAVLTQDISPATLSKHINELLENSVLYNHLQQNCLLVRRELNWKQEQNKLITFYHSIFET